MMVIYPSPSAHGIFHMRQEKRLMGRRGSMASSIRFALENFTLTFLVLGLMASCGALVRAPKPLSTALVVEALFAYFLLFSIGFSFFYNFIIHTFFGEMAARFIGWEDSPFQTEVGFA